MVKWFEDVTLSMKKSTRRLCEIFLRKKKLPWCKENGLELLIMDNDPKLHGKAVVTFMKENGVQIYPGSGKILGYLPLSTVTLNLMRTAKKMVILHEAMIVNLRRLSLQKILNLRRKIWKDARKMLSINEQCICGRMRSSTFGTHIRSNTNKSSLIACPKS